MITQDVLEKIVTEVLRRLQGENVTADSSLDRLTAQIRESVVGELPDLTSRAVKDPIYLEHPENRELLLQMKKSTPARIAVGKVGPRLRTQTYLTLRADHAGARDAVLRDVNEEILQEMGFFSIKTRCDSRGEHLTRPDLGRQLDEDTIRTLQSRCQLNPQVQVYVSDGLSSQAVEANVRDVFPALMDGLQDYGIQTGTPFFMKYGRVPAMDFVSETLGAEVTCVLIGERPGLATANSMSAYIAYRATVGMPEARRTVVSNIHIGGLPPVEAGAHVAQTIKTILENKQSGVSTD